MKKKKNNKCDSIFNFEASSKLYYILKINLKYSHIAIDVNNNSINPIINIAF